MFEAFKNYLLKQLGNVLGSSLSQVIIRKLGPREHRTQQSTDLYSLHKTAPRWLPYCQRVNKEKQISCFGSLILLDSDADIFNTQRDIKDACSAIDLTQDNLDMVISENDPMAWLY